jgi:hypothetical protein
MTVELRAPKLVPLEPEIVCVVRRRNESRDEFVNRVAVTAVQAGEPSSADAAILVKGLLKPQRLARVWAAEEVEQLGSHRNPG